MQATPRTELVPSTWVAIHVARAVIVFLEPSLRNDFLGMVGVKRVQSIVKL